MRTSSLFKSARPLYPVLTVAPIGVASMLFTLSAMAFDLSDTVQLHGFASQAYISTSANKFFGPSDNGSFDFRELGVNLSWQAMSNLQFAGQVTSRKAGTTDDDKPRFDYALMDFSYYAGEADRVGARIGRVKNQFGFYNLTRDVASTRPSIFLPESIYLDNYRSMIISMDGVQLYGEQRSSAGDFFLDIGAGKPILGSQYTQTFKEKQSYIGRLLYEQDGGRVRLAVTGVDAAVGSNLSLVPNGNLYWRSYILSAQYNAEKWGLTTEYQPEQKMIFSGFMPAGIPDSNTVAMSYYLQGTYQVAEDWEALLRYDVLYVDKSDKSGARYAADTAAAAAMGLGMPAPAYSRYAKDWTIGLGWKAMPGVLIRGEFHHVNGTGWLSIMENPVPMATKEHWDMFALQASYSF